MRGTSVAIYPAADHRWHQTWTGTHGLMLDLAGEFQDGRRMPTGVTREPDGTLVANSSACLRLEDGRVRQHRETPADGGTTWRDPFVGLNRRRFEPGGRR